jgi:quinol-cytochrome oxidoreductase complex cytochrome b subunit
MHATNRKLFLVVTAVAEASIGLSLLFLPSIVFALLLGWQSATADAVFVGRIAGASLLAIGAASWMARTDVLSPAQRGLLTGILIYNTAVFILLAYAGAVLKITGLLLWPTAALHAIFAVWCCLLLYRAEAGDARIVRS